MWQEEKCSAPLSWQVKKGGLQRATAEKCNSGTHIRDGGHGAETEPYPGQSRKRSEQGAVPFASSTAMA